MQFFVAGSSTQTAPPSVPESSTALATMVESSVSRSSVELTARVTSPSARQLRDRLGQLARAQLDLLLQVRHRFLQPPGHLVELVGKPFQLVAGLDRDALRKIAAADARGPGSQRLDRAHHASREKHAGQHREERAPASSTKASRCSAA